LDASLELTCPVRAQAQLVVPVRVVADGHPDQPSEERVLMNTQMSALGVTGNLLLDQSITGYDPNRKSPLPMKHHGRTARFDTESYQARMQIQMADQRGGHGV
jgi:hypothetical protein